ncbi:hypothetical protein BvCmsNSP052_01126 [Escherichia coli]|nr:hypothetical protein BvCmsNSP052_01126 [Escherichia coli]GDQ54379.1 hypothetical protein BvCmsNSP072_04355 [Escherichia coli]
MLKKTILALCISAPFLVAGCDDATKENVSKKAEPPRVSWRVFYL